MVGGRAADADVFALESAQHGAGAAVASDLLIIEGLGADGEGWRNGLFHRALQVELSAGAIVGDVILAIESDAGLAGDVPAGLVVMPGHGQGAVLRPAVEGKVGQLARMIIAHRDVEQGAGLDADLAKFPPQRRGHQRIADDEGGVAFFEIDRPAQGSDDGGRDVRRGPAPRQGRA